jgi:hypothetical protein
MILPDFNKKQKLMRNIRWYFNLIFSSYSVYVNKFYVKSPPTNIKPNSNYTFYRLKDKEISDLVTFHDNICLGWNYLFSSEDVKTRFNKEHRCYVCKDKTEILGFMWMAVNTVFSPDLRCTFQIEPHCVISYNEFVRPDCRGQNILPYLRQISFDELKREGYRFCFSYVRTTNKSVIRANKKFNATIIGRITYGYFLGYHFLLPNIPKDTGIKMSSHEDGWQKWKYFFHKLIFHMYSKIK